MRADTIRKFDMSKRTARDAFYFCTSRRYGVTEPIGDISRTEKRALKGALPCIIDPAWVILKIIALAPACPARPLRHVIQDYLSRIYKLPVRRLPKRRDSVA